MSTDLIVFGGVLLTGVVTFVVLWRSRRSKKADTIGDVILEQAEAHESTFHDDGM